MKITEAIEQARTDIFMYGHPGSYIVETWRDDTQAWDQSPKLDFRPALAVLADWRIARVVKLVVGEASYEDTQQGRWEDRARRSVESARQHALKIPH